MYVCVICVVILYICFFFFKQKTAYEMRISDWSSDVCSSDLRDRRRFRSGGGVRGIDGEARRAAARARRRGRTGPMIVNLNLSLVPAETARIDPAIGRA